jgi:hypothetical protein
VETFPRGIARIARSIRNRIAALSSEDFFRLRILIGEVFMLRATGWLVNPAGL